jgi:peroxiredoxin
MKKIILLAAVAALSFSFVITGSPTGLQVGDLAPGFTAKNQAGNNVHLAEKLVQGKVVLLFYRGEWCPFCNRELQAFEDSLALIKAKNAQVIAVSPENEANIKKSVEKTNASYDLISDEGGRIMHAYRVAFNLDSATTAKYKTYGIDLNERNGSAGNSLPVPAVYIIGQDGKITYRFFDENYRTRPSVKEIISKL